MSEFVPWEDHLSSLRWEQGENVTLIGPVKSGKTTLAGRILPERRFVVVLAAKPRDPTLDQLIRRDGYRVVRRWEEVVPRRGGDRVVLWPRGRDPDEIEARQWAEFRECLRDVFMTGGWTVYADDLVYISEFLGLRRDLDRLWYVGRTVPASVVVSCQVPVYVPRAAHDQRAHLYLWRNPDLSRIRRLAEISGAVDPSRLAGELALLRRHEVLYVGPDGDTRRTMVDGTAA